MKTLLLTMVLAVASGLSAQEPATPPKSTEKPEPPAAEAPKPRKRSLLKYTPPKDTASGQRIDGDGGSRSGDKNIKLPNYLCTLTPKTGPALTVQEDPSLFSYLSDPVNMEFRVTINEPKQSKPAFIFAVSQCAAGIHRVNLADYGVTLKPGVEYKWTVAVRPDQKNRSQDLPATGLIKRIEPNPVLVEKLKAAPHADHAAIYAEAGIWYDALSALADQIAANPDDDELQTIRADLLKAAGLDKVKVTKR